MLKAHVEFRENINHAVLVGGILLLTVVTVPARLQLPVVVLKARVHTIPPRG